MKSPQGIRIIAILQFVGACFFTVAAITATNIVLRKATVGTEMVRESSRPEAVMAGMRSFAGILTAWAVFGAAAGYGLWKLRPWARNLTIVQCVLWMSVAIMMLLPPYGKAHWLTIIAVVFFSGINIALVWYFERPYIKSAFKPRVPKPKNLSTEKT